MPPGPQDWWFAKHNAMCGGRYIKVLEPEPPAPKVKPSKEPKKTINNSSLDSFLKKIESGEKRTLPTVIKEE